MSCLSKSNGTKGERRTLKVIGTQKVEVEISDRELARALFAKIAEYIGEVDDGGCDWLTEGNKVYIADKSWLVCESERVATLVDAANVILFGRKLKL